MTITIGLWGIPLAVTLAAVAWAFLMPMPRPQGGAFDFGGMLSGFARLAAVVFVTLVAWLVWALVR